ncbi:MAG: 3-deoxy-manno-octulosonate cytidylyltransferase [Caldithrix sp.]|nr:3-deoxy-manno-octulosonate cytidylyltransferase [Caldithrix sp.]
MNVVCIIPARYHSTRLPGKPLKKLGGIPMIQLVWQQAVKAFGADSVYVATDHPLIQSAVQKAGGMVIMTEEQLTSGTDRVAAAARSLPAEVVINLQGDEPFIDPELLKKLAKVFEDDEIYMATPIARIKNNEDLTNPNLVRVTRDAQDFALYFTRSVIPFIRDKADQNQWLNHCRFFKHIGIYAYRNEFLQKVTRLPRGYLEQAEQLEQLRVLESGFKIYTIETEYHSLSVDTQADLDIINHKLENGKITIE